MPQLQSPLLILLKRRGNHRRTFDQIKSSTLAVERMRVGVIIELYLDVSFVLDGISCLHVSSKPLMDPGLKLPMGL